MKDVLLGGLYSVIGIPVYELCGTSATINVSIEVLYTSLHSLAILYTGQQHYHSWDHS